MKPGTSHAGLLALGLAAALAMGCVTDGDDDDQDDTCTDAAAWLDEAWIAWAGGDIDDAALLAGDAEGCQPADGSKHLLASTAFVRGRYEDAIGLAEAVDPGYERADELPELVIEGLCHLHRCDEALDYAVAQGLDEEVTAPLQLRVDHPLSASLSTLTAIPFDTEAYLAEYLPALDATFNGEARVARLDTGGAVGEHEGMTWFVDSGLVAVDAGKQAALRADTETLLAWGLLDSPDDTTPFLDLGMDLSLGSLTQSGHTVVQDTSEHGNWDFGGVETDGLLGHAFVAAYAWTFDFDEMTFGFTP